MLNTGLNIPYSGKVWRIYSFRAFGEKFWRMNKFSQKVIIVSRNLDGFSLANCSWFAKFTKLFPCQTFLLYSNTNCDCLSENRPSSHNYKYLEIPIWNIQLNISWEGEEVLTRISPLIYSYTISFSWQTLQRTASWIARHFR